MAKPKGEVLVQIGRMENGDVVLEDKSFASLDQAIEWCRKNASIIEHINYHHTGGRKISQLEMIDYIMDFYH